MAVFCVSSCPRLSLKAERNEKRHEGLKILTGISLKLHPPRITYENEESRYELAEESYISHSMPILKSATPTAN